MKAALIPPVAHLDTFCRTSSFHLILSHLLSDNRYYTFYRNLRLNGSYLVLDNGAHENTSGQHMRDLLAAAGALRVNEIVLPDTLFDWKETVAGTERALSYLVGEGQVVWGLQTYPRLMIVPQGKTREEWEYCFQDLVGVLTHAYVKRRDLFNDERGFVVGVSKDYEMWEGGIPSILTYLAPFRTWMTFDVHLLGWGRQLTQLAVIARDFPWVRSTDSAKPFVYAINGISLAGIFVQEDVPEYPRRNEHYFQTTMSRDVVTLARKNVEVFKEFAGDK